MTRPCVACGCLALCLLWNSGDVRAAEPVVCEAIQWDAVMTYEDNTPIPEGTTPLYHIYTGGSRQALTRQVTTDQTRVPCADLPPLTLGDYVVITAVADSLESADVVLRWVRASKVKNAMVLTKVR